MSAATASRQREHTGNGVVARVTPRNRPWLVRWINSLPDSATGIAEAARSASTDVIGVIDPHHHPAGDPLELRDPEYIRRTLPGLRAMSEFYFRAEVRGLGNVPPGRSFSSATTPAAG